MHWAAQYIGMPWRLGATGPDAFDCWGLVRHVQREHYGREMPALAIYESTPDNLQNLHSLLRSSPWKRVDGEAKDGDVFLMHSGAGPHVGIALNIAGSVGVLHAIGSVEDPLSTVFTPRLEDLSMAGFAKIQIWRHHETQKA